MSNKVHKKAQSAIEFVILTGVVIFFFTLFFMSVSEITGEKVKERKNLAIIEIASSVVDEINLALESSDGYTRQFKVPYNINGEEYSINITEDMVYAKSYDYKAAIALPIPTVIGQVEKGNNLIKKSGGQIYININP